MINLFSVAIMNFTATKTNNRNMPQNMSATSVRAINDQILSTNKTKRHFNL
jgi:hypothetical protein